MESLKTNLRSHRKKAGYTQQKLGQLLSVDKNNISNWENGYSSPAIDYILKLSKIFGISTDELLGNDLIHYKKSSIDHYYITHDFQKDYAMNMTNDTQRELDKIYIPGLPDDVELRTFEIGDGRMVPVLLPGDRLICERVEPAERYDPDDVYVVVTADHVYIRQVNAAGADRMQLLNRHRMDTAPIVVDKSEVVELWRGVMRLTGYLG